MNKRIWKNFIWLFFFLLPLNLSAQKAELVVQTGHSDRIGSVAFSPDGVLLASGSNDKTVKIWNAETGKQLKTLRVESFVQSVLFSPNGKIIAASGDSDGIYFWNVEDRKLINKLTDEKGIYREMKFSPDGKILASCGFEFVTFWDVATGKIIRKMQAQTKEYVSSVAFSPDGKTLAASGWRKTINLWNAETGSEIRAFEGLQFAASSIVFSPDGKELIIGSHNKTVKTLDLATGDFKIGQRHEKEVSSVEISPDGKIIASGSWDKTVKIWDKTLGKVIKTFTGHTDNINAVKFSPDGKILVTGSTDSSIRLWNVETGLEINQLKSLSSLIEAIAFSPTGNIFASSDWNKKINIWNLETGGKFQTLDDNEKIVQKIKFSPDGKILASIGWNSNQIKVWDVFSGKLLQTFTEQAGELDSMDFSPDSKILVSASYNDQLSLWNIETGKKIKTIKAGGANFGVTFAKDGKRIVSATEHGTVIIWNIATGKQTLIRPYDKPRDEKLLKSIAPNFYRGNQVEPFSSNGKFQLKKDVASGEIRLYEAKSSKHLASLISIGETDWAVVTPEGLFDSSAGARKQMHFAIGFETVSLEQMKDVYYVPGLLKKIINGEPLPKTNLFSAQDLFPLAEYELPKAGEKEFSVKLTNRGGGIGQVQILVNRKEFLNDARPSGFNPNQPSATLKINLENAPLIDGNENVIEIITRNAEGSISSRGTPEGKEMLKSENPNSNISPNVYLIVGGISNYTGDNLDLRFASKDAADFARALEMGASNLFGADKVHLRLLTSNSPQTKINFRSKDTKVSTATKADFINAFNDFKSAKPTDIFIVYLAGHGVSLSSNQTNSDSYLYLTQEATTNDKTVLAVENSRKAMTISSDELTELIKQNRALKQVLILDTCAAGAAANSLIAKRDLPSDQIRAIERLKDRTGFFILMGAAANKVSYEATQYGQGLLTYSLLQAMKGAKLRENQFADVSQLFLYAQDIVPEMAKYVGGIQRPLIIAPDTSSSFDIGRFTTTEQSQIKLAALKPLILKPTLQNKDLDYDDLELTALLRDELRNASFTVDQETFETPLVFVDADDMIDAVKPSGSYIVRGGLITVTIRLIKNKKLVKTLTINETIKEKELLGKKIADGIKKSVL